MNDSTHGLGFNVAAEIGTRMYLCGTNSGRPLVAPGVPTVGETMSQIFVDSEKYPGLIMLSVRGWERKVKGNAINVNLEHNAFIAEYSILMSLHIRFMRNRGDQQMLHQ